MSKKKNDENEIDGDEKDELLNWNENETFATSEATSRVSDVELLKVTFRYNDTRLPNLPTIFSAANGNRVHLAPFKPVLG